MSSIAIVVAAVFLIGIVLGSWFRLPWPYVVKTGVIAWQDTVETCISARQMDRSAEQDR